MLAPTLPWAAQRQLLPRHAQHARGPFDQKRPVQARIGRRELAGAPAILELDPGVVIHLPHRLEHHADACIRLAQRRSPFHPDKSHFSHRLVELGLKPRNAVLTVHLATLTTGLAGLLLYQVPGWTGAALVVALVACVLAIVAILEFTKRRGGR